MHTDAQRRQLYDELERILSDESRGLLMELLPPIGWSDVARTADVTALRGEISELRVELKSDIARLEMRTEAHFAHVDNRFNDLEGRLNSLEARTDSRFNQMEARFNQMEARFNEMDTRFNDIDNQFNTIDTRFNDIDNQFNEVDTRFNRIDTRFNQLEARIGGVDSRIDRQLVKLASVNVASMISITGFVFAALQLG